jgi:membrane protease YdiL (CAAX protease family)
MVNMPVKQLEEDEHEIRPWVQFLMLTGIVAGALLIFTAVGIGIAWIVYGPKTGMAMMTMDDTAPNFVSGLWIVQIAGTTLPLFFAPVFFASIVVKNPGAYIKPGFRVPGVFYLLVLAIMFTSAPLIEYLALINQKINLPQSMQDSEKSIQKISDMMMQMKTAWSLLFNVLVIGLLTAIAEEFLFRGCFQTIFMRWTKNVHVAVWVTAILFSAFHDEFSGFLPRMLLGILFGYMTAWSGSVWPAVWAHFINNATIVMLTYTSQHKLTNINLDAPQLFNYTAYIVSFIIVVFLLWIYRNIALNKRPVLQ